METITKKQAAELERRLDRIIERLDEIAPVLRERLGENDEQAEKDEKGGK